jgi:hypothetical protein
MLKALKAVKCVYVNESNNPTMYRRLNLSFLILWMIERQGNKRLGDKGVSAIGFQVSFGTHNSTTNEVFIVSFHPVKAKSMQESR